MPRKDKQSPYPRQRYIKDPRGARRENARAQGSTKSGTSTVPCSAPRKVFIIGGGAAGIAAAYTLLEEDPTVSVHLFEARPVFGGRARTDTSISGFAFDMGAQYVQDPHINPWVGIADALGLQLIKEDPNAEAYLRVLDDSRPPANLDVPDAMMEGSASGHDERWCDLAVTVPEVAAITDAIEQSFEEAKELPNAPVARYKRFKTEAQLFGHATSPYGPFSESAEVWRYSAADRSRQYEVESGLTVPEDDNGVHPYTNYFVREGIGTLIKRYGDRLRIRFGSRFTGSLNAVVTAIRTDEAGVTVTTSGQTAQGAACIVTVPVSIMAAGTIAFNPPLEDEVTDAFDAIRLGSYKKLALKLAKIPAEIDAGVNYYIVEDEPEGVWQYYRLPHYPMVLVAHAAGDFAAALDQMPDADVFETFRETLQEAYPKRLRFSKIPTDRAITNWSNDPYACGAYSYTAVRGTDRGDASGFNARRRLRRPIGKNILYAGEATSTDLYATIAGAYYEGVAAAREVIELLS